ncbi:calcium-independent phospholipase A2-gamma-like isoform X1 [Periophthalmus magnuspinnatus]|uniref:calcium-independent phospholipase A2-gamma-like isoform X1 n=2 Tax=Periophthalmus magnuspinnatus TaxID=409849 RepID=UPI00145B191D|nr:calcium-independent phospholipase A2-gamma-like isoform X1 [Periophthalmus magnuspinnatus]
MSRRLAPHIWVKLSRGFVLRHLHAYRSELSSLSDTSHYRIYVEQPGSNKFDSLSQRRLYHHSRIKTRKEWILRATQTKQRLLHTSTLHFNTSTSRWFTGFNMSRVKNTLGTVSKAVSGSHTELLSKIARLKSKTAKMGKNTTAIVDSVLKVEQSKEAQVGCPKEVSHTAGESSVKPVIKSSATTAPVDTSEKNTNPTRSSNCMHVANSKIVQEPKELTRLKCVVTTGKNYSVKKTEETKSTSDIRNKNSTDSQSTPLFHPSTFSVSLDETYNYLAHHINSYFGSKTKTEDKKHNTNGNRNDNAISVIDKTDVTAAVQSTPPKKSIGQYLAHSAPSVQAFVGSYIAPLVPRFRTSESKSPVEEKTPDVTGAKQVDATISKEHKAAEEKTKRLLLQREKIIARVSVDNRTRALVQALQRASDVRVYISRVEDLSYHLLEFPETRGVAVKEKVIPCLLRLKQANDPGLRSAVREALALVGYHKAVKGRGIRILSIDGGGLRGLVALQTLFKLEALTGKPIHKLFDYICGVSTGAVLGFLLGIFQIPLSECDDLYRKLGTDIFKQNVIVGTVKMGWSHAFYDSEAWENLLKEKMGSNILVETARNPQCPKVAAVSTIVNRGTPLKAYVFRNYNLLPGVRSHYLGGCHHRLWQAIRATSAAPGYFQEFTLGQDLHQDGGLLINNPTALAVHESKCLWPDTPLECVVSLGTGRFENPNKNNVTYTSLRTKLTNVISSATDTEEVHAMLDAFLPPDTYFRFNPYLSEEISMDENRQEKFNLLQIECMRYLERNEDKLQKVARILGQEKSSMQRVSEWAKLRADMFNGFPYSSKA